MAENNRNPRRICRNLMQDFEECDPVENSVSGLEDEQRQNAELENEINVFLGANLQSKIQKWNFDFINETPLPGDWYWEKVQKREDSPSTEKPPGDEEAKQKFIHIR